jgi:sugar phosphate isomerase/epimerase
MSFNDTPIAQDSLTYPTLIVTMFSMNPSSNKTAHYIPTILIKISKAILLLVFCLLCNSIQAEEATIGVIAGFKHPVGLQLYSLRDQFAKDVPGTLDKIRAMGFTYVELHTLYGLTPEDFKKQLDARGLKAISSHFPYERFRTDVDGIAREAKILGLEFVGCAWIGHDGAFDEKICDGAIDVFNQAGEKLAKQGLKFFSHTHGYEFTPDGDGTFFDRIMVKTNPKFVHFQMDVFWVVHAGQNPVALMKKYPGRWLLTHIKGMKESTETGLFTGHSDPANDVPLGVGKIDYPPLLRAAAKAGVEWNFLEDESPLVEKQIPQSLEYLSKLKL